MSQVLIVQDINLIQAEDNLTWVFGANPVTFPEPFDDLDYWFTPWAPNAVVVEDRTQRTEAGTVVIVSSDASQCSWEAKGASAEFRSTTITTVGTGTEMIQRGTKLLVPGNNTINFPKAFSDTNYTFPNTIGKNGTLLNVVSKSINSIVVNSSADDELEWLAIGG